MITRANYEIYFLDFYEGVLDARSKDELFAFLDEHPDLRVEFESYSEVKIETDVNLVFSGKSKLHRSNIHERNYISKLVAFIEGDLDPQEKAELDEYIRVKPGVAEELEILRKTRLQPDHAIVFHNKSALKKVQKVIVFRTAVYRTTAVAASLVLLLLSYSLFNRIGDSRQIAEQNVETENPAVLASSNIDSLVAPEIPLKEKGSLSLELNLASNIKSNRIPTVKSKNRVNQIPAVKDQMSPKNDLIAPEMKGEKFDLAKIDVQEKNQIPEPEDAVFPKNEMLTANSPESGASVFSLEELAEFEQMKLAKTKNENTNVWNLAETGVEKLSKITGTKMELDRHHDHIANATTYALEVGKFSFSRTNVK